MTEMAHIYDVIIVGCGPVGAIAANLLGRHGLSTLVLERDLEPYDLPRAIHLDHEIMRIFQSAGLEEHVLPHLHVASGAMFFGADRSVISQFRPNIVSDRLGWAASYHFYQPDLERALRDALATQETVRLLRGHSVTAVAQDEEGVTVTASGLDGPVVARARYMFACDGGRSTVRDRIGVKLQDLQFDEPWIVIDALLDSPVIMPELQGAPPDVDMQDVLFIIGDPARPTSIIPGIGRHRRWEFMLLPHEKPEDYADPARVAELLTPWIGEAPYELIRCAVYRFHALLAERWQVRRIFMLGDAAHQSPPFFGQGMCHGVRDAANLAWKIRMVVDGVAGEGLLDSYEPERRPQVRAVIDASVRTGRYLCTLDPDIARERDREMGAVASRTPPAYIDLIPPLSAGIITPGGAAHPAIGSRFIQPPVTGKGGASGLLDNISGGGFVLLSRLDIGPIEASATLVTCLTVLPDGSDIPTRGDAIIDRSGELAKWFDHHGCSGVLIRPDAYVYGIFDTPAEAAALIASLSTQLAAVDPS